MRFNLFQQKPIIHSPLPQRPRHFHNQTNKRTQKLLRTNRIPNALPRQKRHLHHKTSTTWILVLPNLQKLLRLRLKKPRIHQQNQRQPQLLLRKSLRKSRNRIPNLETQLIQGPTPMGQNSLSKRRKRHIRNRPHRNRKQQKNLHFRIQMARTQPHRNPKNTKPVSRKSQIHPKITTKPSLRNRRKKNHRKREAKSCTIPCLRLRRPVKETPTRAHVLQGDSTVIARLPAFSAFFVENAQSFQIKITDVTGTERRSHQHIPQRNNRYRIRLRWRSIWLYPSALRRPNNRK